MTSDRKKPGVAFWATVVVGGLLLYVASIGPARHLPDWALSQQGYHKLYSPVLWLYDNGPAQFKWALV